MKFRAIKENHLYSKAYSKGKRAVTSALAVYILPDYAAKRLAKAHPEKKVVNRIGLTTATEPFKVEKELRAILPPTESNDFCHRTVLHGRAVCTARKAYCSSCVLNEICKKVKVK